MYPPKLFDLSDSETVRRRQTERALRDIKQMYQDLYKEVSKDIKKYKSDTFKVSQLILLQRNIKQRVSEINKQLESNIKDYMITTANSVVEDTRKFLKRIGFEDTTDAFYYVPDSVVRNIIQGTIYREGWSLSKSIWGHNQDFNGKLSNIVGSGTAKGKSAFDIAKDLETYVNPSRETSSRVIKSWRIARQTDVAAGRAKQVGEKISDKFYFGSVDYNAQRLARTMISHAYQQSFMNTNEHNPFCVGYRWLTSNFHGRVCDVCNKRATQNIYGLGSGVFPKELLPTDHPNGMCTFEAVIPYSMDNIADKISDWYNKPIGTYPDIDLYAKSFKEEI